MEPSNLSPSILTQLQEPLEIGEKLWAQQLPVEFRQSVTLEEGKMLTRVPPNLWPEELRQKAEPYLDLKDWSPEEFERLASAVG